MTLLTVEGLAVSYGAVKAVRDVSLAVEQGELVALLGANGAGKSSTLNAIIGLVPASGGAITFDGADLRKMTTEEIVRRGLTLVPEARRVFPKLTVQENLDLGASGRHDSRNAKSIEETRDELFELFPILAERRRQMAGTLSGGEQQQLAIARALMSSPRMLLMDEPSLGLAPVILETIFELIAELHGRGVTILLVEQNVSMALEVATRGYVLASGDLQFSGSSQELLSSSGIEKAYLGIREGQ